MKNYIVIFFLLIIGCTGTSKKTKQVEVVTWREALKQHADWYASDEAIRIADNLLIYQHETGGWPKNIDMAKVLMKQDVERIENSKKDKHKLLGQPTMDNGATAPQLRYLARVYDKTKEKRYKESFIKGVNYLLEAQYKSGGWPQFYPLKEGYYTHITYNDNAMKNTMRLLQEIYSDSVEVAALSLSTELKLKVKAAYDKGIDCILKTQIIVDDKPTVWCAQHDEKTFEPAKARAYELPSFSGAESVGLVLLLMDIENPSDEIKKAVTGAKTWFETHKMEGIRVEHFINEDGKRDQKEVSDKSASVLWARFYDLETEKPFFCDRDGVEKDSLSEIGYERRNGYGWFTRSPQKILDRYPKWAKKWDVND